MKNFYKYATPYGLIGICDNGKAVTDIFLVDNNRRVDAVYYETKLIKETMKQLNEYFSGARIAFNIPLQYEGTEFQKRVWSALLNIPYGQVVTYKDIAVEVGNPNGARAVGNANNKNPILVVIPCHRVIGSNGKLTGYAGGLDLKSKLLEIEAKFCC